MTQKQISQKSKKAKIIYIIGYGRSGSTILDVVLGKHPEIFGMGEAWWIGVPPSSFLWEKRGSYIKCSCGEKLETCPFYKDVCDKIKDLDLFNDPNKVDFCRTIEHRKSLWHFIGGKFKKSIREDYNKLLNCFFSEIHKKTGKQYLLDSSKSAVSCAYRAVAINKICNYEVKLIHIVRDGRAVIWSMMRGGNQLLENGVNAKLSFVTLRAIYGWVMANLSAHISRLFIGSNNYVRIRYEDFVSEPELVLQSIGKSLQCDMSEVIKALQEDYSFNVSHRIGGNRILRKSSKLSLSQDFEWEHKLKWWPRAIYWLVAWPMIFYYGYHKK